MILLRIESNSIGISYLVNYIRMPFPLQGLVAYQHSLWMTPYRNPIILWNYFSPKTRFLKIV